MTVIAALGVIVQKNVFRAALSLILCLVAVAGIFIPLSADFLAAAQILVYVGAISVVIILAIMLTREFTQGSPSNRLQLPAFIISAVFFGLMTFAVLKTNWQISAAPPQTPTTPALAEQIIWTKWFYFASGNCGRPDTGSNNRSNCNSEGEINYDHGLQHFLNIVRTTFLHRTLWRFNQAKCHRYFDFHRTDA